MCLTLRFLTHQQKDLFFHPNAIHLFGQSLLLLCVFLPLLNLHCVSFDIESTNGAGLLLICPFSCKIDFLCTYGCYSVWMCVFPHSNISEIVGFIESLMKQRGLWCCNVNSVWFGSWLLPTSVLSEERGVKIDRRTHSYNKVAVTEEEKFLCSAVKICKVRKRMAAGFYDLESYQSLSHMLLNTADYFWKLLGLLSHCWAGIHKPEYKSLGFFGSVVLLEERWDCLLIKCHMKMGLEFFWR